jgi:hypothetical protein
MQALQQRISARAVSCSTQWCVHLSGPSIGRVTDAPLYAARRACGLPPAAWSCAPRRPRTQPPPAGGAPSCWPQVRETARIGGGGWHVVRQRGRRAADRAAGAANGCGAAAEAPVPDHAPAWRASRECSSWPARARHAWQQWVGGCVRPDTRLLGAATPATASEFTRRPRCAVDREHQASRLCARGLEVLARAVDTRAPAHTLFMCCAGAAAAALALPQQASAVVIPSQESYGGLGRATGGAGSSPKSPTRASMEGCEWSPARCCLAVGIRA